MCRIKNNEEYTLIKSEVATIDYSSPVTVTVEDPIDCNMTFNFHLIRNGGEESHTFYHAPKENCGIINIVNAPKDRNVRPSQLMELGTYKINYRLFLDYELKACQECGGRRELHIEFGTKNV